MQEGRGWEVKTMQKCGVMEEKRCKNRWCWGIKRCKSGGVMGGNTMKE